jgi:hypothetical protein
MLKVKWWWMIGSVCMPMRFLLREVFSMQTYCISTTSNIPLLVLSKMSELRNLKDTEDY